MILFVFEGGKAEPTVFESIAQLFLGNEQVVTVSCRYDLPTLYTNLRQNDYDLFRSLPLKENGIDLPQGRRIDTLFSQIFLFFDYDFQNRRGVTVVNQILDEMLDFFDDETENGKLYINYPMVESLKYTKDMPDDDYWKYTVSRQVCADHQFKALAEQFAYPAAKGYRFINLHQTAPNAIIANWHSLIQQNASKANYIVRGKYQFPIAKSDIEQKAIFESQLSKYVRVNESVAILNSFPLFLFEYLK